MSQKRVTAHTFVVAGVQVFCGAMGSAAEDGGSCRSVWEQIPDDDAGINQGMLEAAKRRWPQIPEQNQQIMLAWPPAQFRVLRRSVLTLMDAAPTLVELNGALGNGPRIEMEIEEADGGRILKATFVHPGWTGG